ncbi:MAG: ankyrin [Leptospirillum sp. Group IV 'UBA BS']|nr:MAG: ankyrin [Leptospirillum sp. Group IV 'UBA BS']
MSVVREKLDQGADPDETDRNGKSLLFMAASRGETRMVRLLLHYGASPDYPDISGKTPLYQAASNGYSEIVRLLLAHGADPNRRDGEGSPLEWAIANKHEKIVEILKHWTRIRRRYLLRKLPLFLNLVPPSQRLRLEKGPLLATGSLPYALPPGLLTAPWKTRHSFVKEATEADIEERTLRFGGKGKDLSGGEGPSRKSRKTSRDTGRSTDPSSTGSKAARWGERFRRERRGGDGFSCGKSPPGSSCHRCLSCCKVEQFGWCLDRSRPKAGSIWTVCECLMVLPE